jgi:1-acyl-sn-glycerol-3-phosphate acyltransferase
VTVPLLLAATLILTAAAPVLLPLALVVSILPPWRGATRTFAFVLAYLWCETVGVLVAGGIWVKHGFVTRRSPRWPAFLADNYRLQCAWSRALQRSAERIFRLEFHIEGDEALAGPGAITLARHASMADTIIPMVFYAIPHRIRLRYVLKRELLLEPCLDVVGQRLPNAFVRRGSGESAHEVAAIEALGRGLARDEGVVIYPEGTRFTPEKRLRALARLEASGRPELARRGHGLRHLLPPRSAGPLALLEASGDADVLVFAHAGLDGLATLGDLARLGTQRRRIRVRLWRVSRASLPATRGARLAWLYDEWARIDAWLDEVAA